MGTIKCAFTEELALLKSHGQWFEDGCVTDILTVLPEFIVRTESVRTVTCFKETEQYHNTSQTKLNKKILVDAEKGSSDALTDAKIMNKKYLPPSFFKRPRLNLLQV